MRTGFNSNALPANDDGATETAIPLDFSINFFGADYTSAEDAGNGGNRDVFVINADGSGRTRITDTPGGEHNVSWSPDNSKMAFVRDGSIITINANGTNETTIGSGDAFYFFNHLEWSPDSSKILCKNSQTKELFVSQANGSDVKKLRTDVKAIGGTVWSPDSSNVTYVALEQRGANLVNNVFVVNAANGTTTRITDYVGREPYSESRIYSLSWSFDGRRLAYSYLRTQVPFAAFDVYSINADGSNRLRLLQPPFFPPDLNWKPM